jgi:aspartyl/asparaginyl beta-hydroxylase (cupin superfamily)
MKAITVLIEWLITTFSRDGYKTFFDNSDFSWVESVEAGTPAIRRELDVLLERREHIPNFQDLSDNQKELTEGEQWKTFVLYGYGRPVTENCAMCPETIRVLKMIPGMKTAMFSILAPGKHIPEHCGPYKGVLRYHLGLMIPKPESLCRIRVGGDTRSWAEGKSLIFDDRYPHEAWNDSGEYRVVLFVDLLRPLPLPLALVNRLVVWAVSLTPYITVGIQRARAASRKMTEAPVA